MSSAAATTSMSAPNTSPQSFHPLVLDNGGTAHAAEPWEVVRPMLEPSETPAHESIVVEFFPHELQTRARGVREFSTHQLTAAKKVGLLLILFSACKNPQLGAEPGAGSEADAAQHETVRKQKRKSKPRKTNFLSEEAAEVDENENETENYDPNGGGNDDAAVEAALEADPAAMQTASPALGVHVDQHGVHLCQRILVFFEVVRSELGEPLVLRYVFVNQDRHFSWDRYISTLIKINAQRRIKTPRKFEEDQKKKWLPHLSLVSQEDWMAKYLSTVCPPLMQSMEASGLPLTEANPGSVTRVLGMVSYFDQIRRVLEVSDDPSWIPESARRVVRQCRRAQYTLNNYAVTDVVNGRVAALKYQFPAATRADVWQYDFLSAKPEMVWVTQFPHIPPDESQMVSARGLSAPNLRAHFLRVAAEACTRLGDTETNAGAPSTIDRVQVLAETNEAALKRMDASERRVWRAQAKNWNALLDAMTESSASMGAVARFYRERCDVASANGHNGPLLQRHSVPCTDVTLTQFQNWILHFYRNLDENFNLRGNHDTALYLVTTSVAPFAYNGNIVPHTVMTGAAGTGKSFLLDLLKLFMIPGTFEAFTRVTNKVFETVDDQNNLSILFDEMSRHVLGMDEAGRGTGGTGDPAIKSALSSAIMSLSSFFQDDAGVRRAIKIFKEFHSLIVGASNDARDDFAPPIQSRLFMRDILQTARAFEENVDRSVAEMFAEHAPDEVVARRTAFVDEMHDLMMLTILAMQAIRVKLLPEPNTGFFNLCVWRFLHFLSSRGVIIKEDRKYERMQTSAYILTVMQAVLDVFWTGEPTEFQFSDLSKLADHLCTDVQTSAVVLSMHFDQYVDVLEGEAVKAFVGDTYAAVRTKLGEASKDLLWRFFPDSSETTAPQDRHPVHGVDLSYVMITCEPTRMFSQLECAAQQMANALNRRGFTCTAQQMLHRIQTLCKSFMNNRKVMRLDEGHRRVFILREWLELAYTTTPWEMQREALETLASPYMHANTRLLTLCPTHFSAESKSVPELTLFHLPRVVDLEGLRGRSSSWIVPCNDMFRQYDCDAEEYVATEAKMWKMVPARKWRRWQLRAGADASAMLYPHHFARRLQDNHRVRCVALAGCFAPAASGKDETQKQRERMMLQYGAGRRVVLPKTEAAAAASVADERRADRERIDRVEMETKRRRLFL